MNNVLFAAAVILVVASMGAGCTWIFQTYPDPTPFAVFLLISLVGSAVASVGLTIHWWANR